MSDDDNEFWRATPQMPSEAPDWVNRDYPETDTSQPSRRWLVWTTAAILSIMAIGGLWNTLEPLLK